VAEWKDGKVSEYDITPEDFGIQSQSLIGLAVDGAQASLELIQDALGKRKGPQAQKAADMIILNAGAAIYVSGKALTHKLGVQMAEDALYSGLALERMEALRDFTRALA
jgi:anthranilate phosphoribosyltransferase